MIFTPLLANSGLPFTISMLGLPLRVWIATFGLAGVAIVLLEAWGLHQRESVSWRQALSTSFDINVVSTLIGVVFTFMYAASGLLIFFILNVILLSWFSGKLLIRLLVGRRGSSPSLAMQFSAYLISAVGSSIIFISAGWLNSGIGVRKIEQMRTIEQIISRTQPTFPLHIYITAFLGLMSINFLLTWIIESYRLTGLWKDKDKSPAKLCLTVFWVNVRSYVYILLPITILGGLLNSALFGYQR
ncbi:MAG: hypothetical protein HC916_03530 [Coleofasciculaceae cyanobacterium SM2_1_6]|nr:hypothetical protein [Coleofasciculaceae cyanobacterium SM2_1_6]